MQTLDSTFKCILKWIGYFYSCGVCTFQILLLFKLKTISKIMFYHIALAGSRFCFSFKFLFLIKNKTLYYFHH